MTRCWDYAREAIIRTAYGEEGAPFKREGTPHGHSPRVLRVGLVNEAGNLEKGGFI